MGQNLATLYHFDWLCFFKLNLNTDSLQRVPWESLNLDSVPTFLKLWMIRENFDLVGAKIVGLPLTSFRIDRLLINVHVEIWIWCSFQTPSFEPNDCVGSNIKKEEAGRSFGNLKIDWHLILQFHWLRNNHQTWDIYLIIVLLAAWFNHDVLFLPVILQY